MMPQRESSNSSSHVPRSFMCPLTLEVMVEPVIDAEGNTFEKKALLQWLSHYGVSPISRQPLNASLVVPNFALRDTIYEVMGSAWVAKRIEELDIEYPNEMEDVSEGSVNSMGSTRKADASKYRRKIQCYLQKLSRDVGGGMELELDDDGVCMFNCENMTIAVEVPVDLGFVYVSTVVPVPTLSEESKDMLLELNRLQSETRGGTLSIKKHASGHYDIFFSYSDRVDEISAADFCNIVLNFIETSARLRVRFLGPDYQLNQDLSTFTSDTTTSSYTPQQIGMATKFV